MKKALFATLLCLSSMNGAAQSKVGTFSIIPRLGINVTDMSGKLLSTSIADNSIWNRNNSDSRVRFAGGVDLMYQLSDMFAVSAGAFYSQQGCRFKGLYEYSAADKSLTATELSPAKLDYINVPFMLHGYVVKGLSLNAGVQVGFLTKVKWSGKQVKAFLNEEHGTIVPSEPSQMSTMNEFIIKNTDAFHKVDISVPLGASYEFMNVVLDARYNLGLTKVSKGGSSKNRVFMVTLGYKFDL